MNNNMTINRTRSVIQYFCLFILLFVSIEGVSASENQSVNYSISIVQPVEDAIISTEEVVFIFSTFFFVYVGVCMKFGSIGVYLIALLIVVLIILIRPISVKLFVRSKMSSKDLGIMSIMAPKGLVPAILASMPIQYGLTGGEDVQMLSFAVVLLSILICSILVIILSKNSLKFNYLNNILKGKSAEEQVHPNSNESQELDSTSEGS